MLTTQLESYNIPPRYLRPAHAEGIALLPFSTSVSASSKYSGTTSCNATDKLDVYGNASSIPPGHVCIHSMPRKETNQLRMSAERMGALMREEMEPVPARLASTGSLVTAEQAGHYCIPVKLKKLYRQKKLGSPFAPEEEPAKRWVRIRRLVNTLPRHLTTGAKPPTRFRTC